MDTMQSPSRAPLPEQSDTAEVPPEVDLAALEVDLRRTVRGQVSFEAGERALYATDASNHRQVPLALVCPVDADDAEAALAVCTRHRVPVLSRGAGTSLAGQTCNVAVVLDFTVHMNRIVEIDPERRLARVQPGVVLDDLRKAAEAHGLTFAPDPATHRWCTLGGMIGNNSCGVHSVMGGRTVDNVEALEVATTFGWRGTVTRYSDAEYDRLVAAGGPLGRLLVRLRGLRDREAERIRARFPRIPRRVSGFNLDELLPERGFHVARSLVGTEGTCALVLEATLRLVPWPPHRALLVLGYPDVFVAADQVPQVLAHQPLALEGLDDRLVDFMRRKGLRSQELEKLGEGEGWLLVEFGGQSAEEARHKAQAALRALQEQTPMLSAALYDDPAHQEHVWAVRESGLAATARVPGEPDAWPGWEDSAVPPARLGAYLRELRALMDRFGYKASIYGHFGDGCVHCRIPFQLGTEEGVADYRAFLDEAADLVLAHGGSLSGEHGDGVARAALLPKMYGQELVEAMRQFKQAWDPTGLLNPGKVVDAPGPTSDLRLGPGHAPARPATFFRYPDDDGALFRATERCVGVGKCRQLGAGTMCPSFKATRDEKHSTRGRAHLLHEMLRPDGPIEDGFESEAVKEALDLCLSCKACKGECPMKVDLATYKAEFMHQHWKGRVRPREAWFLGRIHLWSRLASFAPGLANVALRLPGVERLAKQVAGMAADRPLPAFADRTFRSWFAGRAPARGRPVLLWVDTWTEHFQPEVGKAAVEVLEAAGFSPRVHPRPLCCGRPLYDFGLLDEAKAYLDQVIEQTAPYVEQGMPVVVLEPSCTSVFRDELRALRPDDPSAERLAERVTTLAELLQQEAPTFRPRLHREVVVHGHCHQQALWGVGAETALLRDLGAKVRTPDTGCCGMAGAFGYEARKYPVSVAIAEDAFLPRVGEAGEDALVHIDAFSCRSQLQDLSHRRGLHLAQVVRMALRDGSAGTRRTPPEKAEVQPVARPGWAAAVALALLGLLAVMLLGRSGRVGRSARRGP